MHQTRTSTVGTPRKENPDPPSTPVSNQAGVGYGRPPRHTRFKPGQSGTPGGRPKYTRNLKTIIQQALTGRITVREGERRRTITKLEGVVLRQVEGALKGNDRAALATLKIAAQVGLLDEADGAFATPPLSPAEQQILDKLLKQASSPKSKKSRRHRP
jgi:hypothetical protein